MKFKRGKNTDKARGVFKSLYVKFVALFSAVIILAAVCIGVAVYNNTASYLLETKQEEMQKAVDAISYLMVKYVKSDEYNKVQDGEISPDSDYYMLRSRMATCYEILGADIFISDSKGNVIMSFPLLPNEKDYIITDTVYFEDGFENRFLYLNDQYSFINPEQYINCFKTEDFVVDFGNYHGFYTEKEDSHLTVSKRIASYQEANVETFGAVIMSFPMPQLAESRNEITTYVLITTALAIVLAMVVIMFMTKIMTKPLEKLKVGAGEIAGGNFKIKIEKTTKDEIGELVDAFNTAAKSLDNLDTVRNDFIANVSHELRTPMTSIKGFVEAIMDGIIPEDRQHEYLKKVHREICRMNDLVNDLLDWARLSAGQGNFNMANFDVNKVVVTVVSNLEPLIMEKNINMVIDFEKDKHMVYGDAKSIERVFINIISNAVKFTPENGEITVKVSSESGKVRVDISDTGIGMSEKEMELIFERFYKADKSRSSEKKSTGLGLSIVKKILQSHNQNISVKSTPGQGSCFTFTLDEEKLNEKD